MTSPSANSTEIVLPDGGSSTSSPPDRGKKSAFSVENAYRKRGLGEKLFRRITEAARNHGVEVIEIVCLAENIAMRRLAAKFKAEFTFDSNQLLGKLTARRPTPFSMMREMASDFADFGEAMMDANLRALNLGDAA